MKKIVLILGLLFSTQLAFTQAPEKINYQAVARDASGNPLVNQTLNVTYQIRQSSPTGTSVYTETHSGISTNQFGLFTAEIGGGTPSVGTFAGINWGAGLYYLYVEVNGDPMGSSQLLSVPYALYAKQSANGPQGLPGRNSISIVTPEPSGANCQNGGNKIDVGTDDNGDNILQALEIDFTYFVCNGDSGTAVGDDWGNQVVTTQGSNISGDGTTANPLTVTNNDNDSTNELQDLSIAGNTINITNGTGITLSSTTPTTNQVLTWNGTAWTAQNATSGADNWGSQVVVSDATLTGDGTTGNPLGVNGVLTDNQDLSLTGNSLSLTNDPTPVDLSPYLDNTDAQTLSINANTLAISNGNSVTLPTAPTYTAGTGINLTGNVITNTAPDQTVALNNGTGINVTGTYPNFTINNTSPASGINITGGGITSVSGTSPNFTISTPAQTLTYTAPNLTLSNGGGTVTISPSLWTKTGSFIHHNILTDSVGIGTNTPNSKLHVQGNYSSLGTIGTFIDLQNTFGSSTSPAKVGIRFKTSNLPNGQHTKGGIIYSRTLSNARGDMLFLNNSNDDISEIDVANDVRLIIKNNGDVGIGTTTPGLISGATKYLSIVNDGPYSNTSITSLELKGNTNAANSFSAYIDFINGLTPTNIAKIGATTSNTSTVEGQLTFSTNDGTLSERMRITQTGNVGIGTSNPLSKLHVINNEYSSSYSATIVNTDTLGDGLNLIINSTVTNRNVLNARVNANDVFTIKSNGYVGILDNTPIYPLTVNGNGQIVGNFHVGTPTTTNAKASIWGAGWANAFRVSGSTNNQIFMIESGGDIAIGNINPAYDLHLAANSAAKPTTNTWTVASDKNLKKDIKPFTGGLADVLKINPVWFTYNGKAGMPEDTGVGVIAQELQKIAPFMVSEWEYKPSGAEEGDVGEKYLGVDNGAMTYMLINAIKEQQKMIEELQKEIKELKENK